MQRRRRLSRGISFGEGRGEEEKDGIQGPLYLSKRARPSGALGEPPPVVVRPVLNDQVVSELLSLARMPSADISDILDVSGGPFRLESLR